MSERVHAFAPVADRAARALIVGSMPGAASLRAQCYYAHPHNAFWPIVTELLGGTKDAPYAERTALLRAHGIALWDVLQSCERDGSLDSAIAPASIVVNDFAAFVRAHPRLEHVLCNGGTAHAHWRRHVAPTLPRELAVVRLPSTSPAHASLRPAQKLAAWRAAFAAAGLLG